MIRICLIGLGKTGSEVAKVLLGQEDIKLVAAVCQPGSAKEGKDLGEVTGTRDTGITVTGADKLKEVIFRYKPDIALDFSKPEATIRNAVVLSRMKVNLVIATTGFSKFSMKRIFALTKKYHNGIVYAPNITLGVNVLMLLTSIASSILNTYDFQINEAHHNKKKDIPSGTALKIAGEIEKALASSEHDKEGIKGSPAGAVPINAVRAGGIVGRHDVVIAGEEDMIEISHQSFSRKAFAMGAIRAVKFIYKKTGYFEMSDVLNLGSVLSKYVENEIGRQAKRGKYLNVKDDGLAELS